MIPDLALIITAYILYRLIETSISAVQRNKTSGVVLAVLAAICALVVCSLAYDIMNTATHNGSMPTAQTSSFAAPSLSAKHEQGATPLAQFSLAPDFALESLDGKTMRLSDLRGKAVLLNFWATRTAPCKIEMPWLADLQNKYGSQGLQIVGVAMDDSSKEDIAKFARDMGVNYPVLLGKEAVGEAFGGVPALPESFFIGRDGKIVDKIIGLKGKSEIEDSIKKALDTQPAESNASANTVRENGPAP